MSTKPRSALHARIGQRVRRLRVGSGLTQARLAERVGMSSHFISGIERGVDSPSLGTLEALAAALGSSVAELVAEPQSHDNDPTAQIIEMIRSNQHPQLTSVLREIVALYRPDNTD